MEQELRSNVIVHCAPSHGGDQRAEESHHREPVITAAPMSGVSISADKDDDSESNQALQPLVPTDDVDDRAKRMSEASREQAQGETQAGQYQDNTVVEEQKSVGLSRLAHPTADSVQPEHSSSIASPSQPSSTRLPASRSQPSSTGVPVITASSISSLAATPPIVPRHRIPKKATSASSTGELSVTTSVPQSLSNFSRGDTATAGAQVSSTQCMEMHDNSASVRTPQAADMLLYVARQASPPRESPNLLDLSPRTSAAVTALETQSSAVPWLFARQSTASMPIQIEGEAPRSQSTLVIGDGAVSLSLYILLHHWPHPTLSPSLTSVNPQSSSSTSPGPSSPPHSVSSFTELPPPLVVHCCPQETDSSLLQLPLTTSQVHAGRLRIVPQVNVLALSASFPSPPRFHHVALSILMSSSTDDAIVVLERAFVSVAKVLHKSGVLALILDVKKDSKWLQRLTASSEQAAGFVLIRKQALMVEEQRGEQQTEEREISDTLEVFRGGEVLVFEQQCAGTDSGLRQNWGPTRGQQDVATAPVTREQGPAIQHGNSAP